MKKLYLGMIVAGIIGVRGSIYLANQEPNYSQDFIQYRELEKRLELAPENSRNLITRIDSLERANDNFRKEKQNEKNEELKKEFLAFLTLGSVCVTLYGGGKSLEGILKKNQKR